MHEWLSIVIWLCHRKVPSAVEICFMYKTKQCGLNLVALYLFIFGYERKGRRKNSRQYPALFSVGVCLHTCFFVFVHDAYKKPFELASLIIAHKNLNKFSLFVLYLSVAAKIPNINKQRFDFGIIDQLFQKQKCYFW